MYFRFSLDGGWGVVRFQLPPCQSPLFSPAISASPVAQLRGVLSSRQSSQSTCSSSATCWFPSLSPFLIERRLPVSIHSSSNLPTPNATSFTPSMTLSKDAVYSESDSHSFVALNLKRCFFLQVSRPYPLVLISAKEEPYASIPPAVDGLLKIHQRVINADVDPTHPPAGGTISSRLLVAATQAGNLIGKQGATIKTIQDSSNCIIRVLGKENLHVFALPDDSVVEMQMPSARPNQEMAPPQPWAAVAPPPQNFPVNTGGDPIHATSTSV
ncbi:hypothetical protein L2E82_43492 [Cichorium intybus]|uniref:Uncharacterized protein n=1 Tax=Cichorium intybus TaxID=13427 RepID=A0ACB8ZMQ4_CICIN|nr:hypothetical protein L2E82_43492 [Cichorium intybus]